MAGSPAGRIRDWVVAALPEVDTDRRGDLLGAVAQYRVERPVTRQVDSALAPGDDRQKHEER